MIVNNTALGLNNSKLEIKLGNLQCKNTKKPKNMTQPNNLPSQNVDKNGFVETLYDKMQK